MRIYGVVMAGGGGTRFWPLSRREVPKQFLNLSGKDYMVNEAIDRLASLCNKRDIFVVTNEGQVKKLISVIRGRVERTNILAEPASRNTAACIGYAAMELLRKYGDGIMCITPSDAYVANQKEFVRTVQTAIEVASKKNCIATVGITPTYAATGYGYIKLGEAEGEVFKVVAFREKPDKETALTYVESGQYVWNSGMFVCKASTMLGKFEEILPDIYADLCKIGDSMGTDGEYKVIDEVYPRIRSISIDYGIMERSLDVYVVPGEFGWNDLGSFEALRALHSADADGNICVGERVSIDSRNCITYSSGRLIATVGLDGVDVIETEDAVLVCSAGRVQDVKRVVEQLKKSRRVEFL